MSGKPFYLATLDDAGGQTAVFADVEFVQEVLAGLDTVEFHLDGTFKVVPHGIGYQLVTMHFMHFGHVSSLLLYKYLLVAFLASL